MHIDIKIFCFQRKYDLAICCFGAFLSIELMLQVSKDADI